MKYLVAIALTLLLLRPLLGNTWYPMHDTTHVARLYLMEESIRGGQFPPVWAEGINNGYGYPLFHFYAPAFYYTTLLVKQVAGSYILALKLTLGLFLILGGLGVMAMVSKWGKGAMVLAAVLFVTSPYLAVDLFVRGAFAELAALCLLPWVLYAWQDLETKRQQILAGVVTALFLLSHNLIPVLAFPLVAIWVLAHHYRGLRKLIVPTILTFLLSTSLLLPLLFERGLVQADAVAKTSDYSLHFVEPWQIWNSTWGFGGSAPGVEDGFSFKMGKLHLVLALLGALTLILKKHKYWLLGILTLSSLLMTTAASSVIWQNLPFLALAQFPWRFLAVATTTLAVTGAASILLVKNTNLRKIAIIITTLTLLALNLKYFAPQSTFPADDSRFTNESYLNTVASIIPEYLPTDFDPTKYEGKPTVIDSYPLTTDFNNLDAGADEIEFVVNRAYYPTWQVKFVEAGTGRKLNAWTEKTYQGGLLGINLQRGKGQVIIYQGHTPIQKISYALTLLGLALSLYWWRKK